MKSYFEFYGLKPRMNLDEAALRLAFLKISKEHHPDFFINDEHRQGEALEKTSLNNRAYLALKTLRGRLKHYLEFRGLLNEKGGEVPAGFLMEMMELNEAIMDIQMNFDAKRLESIQKEEEELWKNLQVEIADLATEFDNRMELGEGVEDLEKKLLEAYLKEKYLLRIKDSLSTFAAQK